MISVICVDSSTKHARTSHHSLRQVAQVSVLRERFDVNVEFDGEMTAMACWFATDFEGGELCRASKQVKLDTSPRSGYSHWGQQIFHLSHKMMVRRGDTLAVDTLITRQQENNRMVQCRVGLTCTARQGKGKGKGGKVTMAPRLYAIQ